MAQYFSALKLLKGSAAGYYFMVAVMYFVKFICGVNIANFLYTNNVILVVFFG